MSKKVILTGLRANNDLHLGNYSGALPPMVEFQKKYAGQYQINLFVPDLHSFTTPIDHSKLYEQTMHNLKLFVAAGLDLDDQDTFIYRQSYIPAHSELTVILNSFTYMGELSRMTQFKEKSEKQDSVSAGLFDYPVLMAADILLYDAKYVPVGEDQLQHLELTRTLARKFNSKFGNTFVEPKALLTETPRVMSLGNPEKKMSKSQPETCIFLDDTPEQIRNKVKRAVTDSGSEVRYDPAIKPGISNLLSIYSALSGDPIKKIEAEFAGKNYGHFKAMLAEVVISHFAEFRKKKRSLMAKPNKLRTILIAGSKKAEGGANKKIREVKKKIGLEESR